MLQAFIDFFTLYVPAWLTCFVISMTPVLELRGGLIAASVLNVPWPAATAVCVLGNIVPVPVILLFVRKALDLLSKTGAFGRIASHFQDKALSKGAELTKKYPGRILLGLFLFVAVPLPMTGAWTGSLAAAFLGIPLRRAFPVIVLGVFGAACVMLLLAYAFPAMMGFKV